MTITLNGTTGITTPAVDAEGNVEYTGTLTGGTGVVNIGSGQVYKDASGNVGIGTTSITNPYSSSNYKDMNFDGVWGGVISFKLGGTLTGWVGNSSSGNAYIGMWGATGQPIIFGTNGNTERARITSSGNWLVNRTASSSSAVIHELNFAPSSQIGIRYHMTDTTYNNAAIEFIRSDGTRVGYIYANGSSTAYVTSSDYRLKEDWQPMTGASERVKALKPVNFAWKVDGSRVDGFLAHEAQAVVPEAVTGVKDATEMVDVKDEEGNVTGQEERPVYQGIDQSKLVPLLTAALQEALTKIDALTARVEALEGATT